VGSSGGSTYQSLGHRCAKQMPVISEAYALSDAIASTLACAMSGNGSKADLSGWCTQRVKSGQLLLTFR
jgi:hypothetical protein